MSTLKTYFEQVAAAFPEEKAIWTPGWWFLTINRAVKEMIETEPSNTDMFHYENLKILIQKVTRLWSNCYQRWGITSLEDLLKKTGPSQASMFKTSLHLEVIENVISYINICLSKDPLSEETCSDSALMTIMSTCSIPALLVVPNASVVGEKRSRVEPSDQGTDSEATSESGDETTLSMQSFISFIKKGEERKRGLTEEVKDLRISLKVYNGAKWRKHSGEYYDYPIHKVDLTFDRSTPMESSLNQFLKDANEHMDSLRGVKKIKEVRNRNGKSYQGRFNNSWRKQPYAR
nr:MAG: NS2 [Canine parvovirus]